VGGVLIRGFRTFVSAVVILVGAALVVMWGGSWIALKAIDDGTVAHAAVSSALSTPAVTATIADAIEMRASASLAGQGIDVEAAGVGQQVSDAFGALATSPEFKSEVLAQVDAAQSRLQEELSRDDRAEGPFVVSVDITASVSERLEGVLVMGPATSEMTVEPVEVEVISAPVFEKARTAYSRLEYARGHFLWAGLAFIALGVAVSTRRRFVIPKFLIAVGALTWAVAAVLMFASSARLTSLLPGGEEGTWGDLLAQSLADDALPGIRRTLAFVGLIALIAGGVMMLVAKYVGRAKR